MFWKKKKPSEPGGDPLGVPLSTLLTMLQPTTIRARQEGSVVVAEHGTYTTRVEVAPADAGARSQDPIRAIVRVLTTLPDALASEPRLRTVAAAGMLNRFAALGAVGMTGRQLVVGSRLTIFTGEEHAWDTLHLPLLAFTVIGGGGAVLGGFRRVLGGQSTQGGASEWTPADLQEVRRNLSRVCVCNASAGGLTAEFGLREEASSVLSGLHHGSLDTALFTMTNREPHPELGGGLLCLLQLPHTIGGAERQGQICGQLNHRELAGGDQPPHFGAWCPSDRGSGVTYVTFLPNVLHKVEGIASNVAVWALHRAQWADQQLESLGVPL